MTIAAAIDAAPPASASRPLLDRLRVGAIPVLVVVAILVAGHSIGHQVPTWLDAHVMPAVDRLYHWTVINNDRNWLFTDVFSPISTAIHWSTTHMLSLLQILRWPGVLALVGAVGLRTGGWRAALTGVVVMSGCGFLGFWDDTLITLSLMLVAVIVALLIGIPLGVWCGLSDRAEKVLRTFLDTAQVLPVYVYLLPLVVAFGIGDSSAVVATVIYAVPPAVRITSLGLRAVSGTLVEVGESFGSTGGQLLTKVRLPLARRPILLGVNQVIMMAFAIVVYASLIGTGGLGNDVLLGLQKVDVGKAFAPGLAIVFAAIAIDRVTTGQRTTRQGNRAPRLRALAEHPFAIAVLGLAAVVAVAVVAKVAGADHFPSSWSVDVVKPVNSAAKWVNDHFRKGVPIVGGTGSFSDFVVLHLLNPVRDPLQSAAWYVIVAAAAALGWIAGGWRLGAACVVCFVGIGALRVWDLAMDTLSQVLVAAVLSLLIAIPLGVWAARSGVVERILRPLLDVAQVMPAFVYLVPVIFLFNVGRVPGVVASIIYAVPPGIRLTTLGLRQVPFAPREAAMSFGATPRQELLKVQLPLAARSIMLAVNQVIIMVLSVHVVASLIGAGGLGLETVYGLTKKQIGRGMAGGLAIVLLAIFLDRVTQAFGTRRERLQGRTRRRPTFGWGQRAASPRQVTPSAI
ncbi:MAG: glycine/betaine transporter permease [Ilumatobacteraceae bacterium]|nr:glycine/betaine transporter permease [Ilumatobacteraceae bacterium]